MTAGPSKRRREESEEFPKGLVGCKKTIPVNIDIVKEKVQKLTTSFGNLEGYAKKTEVQMLKLFKDITVQQSGMLACMYGLIEEHKSVIEEVKCEASNLNKGSTNWKLDDLSHNNELCNFLNDSAFVLRDHTQRFLMQMELLNEGFENFASGWKATQSGLKVHAMSLDGEERKLITESSILNRKM